MFTEMTIHSNIFGINTSVLKFKTEKRNLSQWHMPVTPASKKVEKCNLSVAVVCAYHPSNQEGEKRVTCHSDLCLSSQQAGLGRVGENS